MVAYNRLIEGGDMKQIKLSISFAIILAVGIASAEMDWENKIIKTSAINQTTAADLLKKELYSLQYDRNRTVGDFFKAHFDREFKLTELLFQYQTMKQNYLTDGSIEYVYQLPMTNKIMSLLLPDTKPVKLVVPMLCPCCGQNWPIGKHVPEGLELIPKQIESTEYTGIIIDCRNLKMTPCLFPKVFNDQLEEVYSINFADLNHVVDRGLVLYSTQDLYNHPRVGYNPLRVRAIGAVGAKFTDIKISSFDARRIHGSKKNIDLLKECRIAFIIGF